MAFQKGDKNINRAGRKPAHELVNPKIVSKEEIREKELKQILRRLKPLVAKAIIQAEKILESESSSEQSRMRAIALIMTEYPKLLNDLYKETSNGKQDNGVDKDELEDAPIVSFKVLNGGK